MAGPELNDRAQLLLKNLVERYIRDGQPIGSRTLSRETGLELSAATIRNVMADLEDHGLIHAPHTSAGRVPTNKGYRLFVDSLLTIKQLDNDQISRMQQRMGSSTDPEHLLSIASQQLSEVTSMAGVVMIPKRKLVALRQVEFLPLSHNRVLAILVVNEREVQNRIIQTGRSYGAGELQQIANYLNKVCAGRDLVQARAALLGEMDDTRSHMNQLMADAVQMAQAVFATDEMDGDYLLEGQTNLMSYEEMANLDKLRRLFDAFNQKRDILQLLDQAVQAEGVQLFIGNESGYEVLDECSVVASPYKVDGEVLGVLGVIGPTRMAYDRVISIVDVTAQLLGASLNQIK
jgi:heat-inducible transcriptional repressor